MSVAIAEGRPPKSMLRPTATACAPRPVSKPAALPNFWRILKREPRSSPTRLTIPTPRHIAEAGAVAATPSKASRKKQRPLDRDAERNVVERFFCQ